MKCHGDDTPLTFYGTPLFSLFVLLIYVSKFIVHDTLMTLLLKLALYTVDDLLITSVHTLDNSTLVRAKHT